MKMETVIGKTYLKGIPHNGGTRSFQYPAFKGNYGKVAEQIDEEGLKRPSSAETASLVYDAFQNPKGKYESNIIQILKDSFLWEFTGNLYLPKSNEEVNNGVILDLDSQNLKFANGRLQMDKKSLVKRLQENEPLVKFVPFGFKTGEQNVFDLEKNPYIIARYGEEGSQKIVEVASKYKKNPFLNLPDSVNRERTEIATLYSGRYFGGVSLNVGGDDWGGGSDGYAFGVCAPEKSE